MRLLFSLLLAGFLLAGSPVVNNDAAKTGLDPARLAQIPVRMKQFVDSGTAAGIVTLVARHGKVAALDAVGYTDLETRQPIKADAIFQIHSMTKPIVALAAMMLAEEGKLSIGDPVEKYLPEFRGQWVVESQGSRKDGAAPSCATSHIARSHDPYFRNELEPAGRDQGAARRLA